MLDADVKRYFIVIHSDNDSYWLLKKTNSYSNYFNHMTKENAKVPSKAKARKLYPESKDYYIFPGGSVLKNFDKDTVYKKLLTLFPGLTKDFISMIKLPVVVENKGEKCGVFLFNYSWFKMVNTYKCINDTSYLATDNKFNLLHTLGTSNVIKDSEYKWFSMNDFNSADYSIGSAVTAILDYYKKTKPYEEAVIFVEKTT